MGYNSFGYVNLDYVPVATGDAPDLLAAVLAHLRATPAVVSAFGEDTSAAETTKFWGSVSHKCSLPWAVYEEISGNVMYMTGSGAPSIEEGQIRFVIVSAEKKQARDLGRLLADTLTDAVLTFDDGLLMNFRARNPFFVPIAAILPDSPSGYARVVVFDYMCQRG